jgi:hypothetical protein
MGQKSNTLTLRTTKNNLNLLQKDSKSFLYGFKFLNFFEKLLNKKGVVITEKTLNFVANQVFFTSNLFFRTIKTINYKRKGFTLKVLTSSKPFCTKNVSLEKLFSEQFKFLNNTIIVFNCTNLNIKINKNVLTLFYHRTKRFSNVLFTRRFNFYVDFLKLTSLFYQNQINTQSFVSLLGQLFRVLPKRKHNRFLFFLKFLFQTLVEKNSTLLNFTGSSITGIKFIVNGKLQGKTRATSSCIQVGAVPIQTIDKNIDFAKTHVYTLYGAFGFQMWVSRQ